MHFPLRPWRVSGAWRCDDHHPCGKSAPRDPLHPGAPAQTPPSPISLQGPSLCALGPRPQGTPLVGGGWWPGQGAESPPVLGRIAQGILASPAPRMLRCQGGGPGKLGGWARDQGTRGVWGWNGGRPTLLPKLRGPGSPSAPRARPQAQDWKVGGAVVKPAPRLRPSREGLALPPRVGSRQLSGQGCLPPLSQQRPVYCWDWQLP